MKVFIFFLVVVLICYISGKLACYVNDKKGYETLKVFGGILGDPFYLLYVLIRPKNPEITHWENENKKSHNKPALNQIKMEKHIGEATITPTKISGKQQ